MHLCMYNVLIYVCMFCMFVYMYVCMHVCMCMDSNVIYQEKHFFTNMLPVNTKLFIYKRRKRGENL